MGEVSAALAREGWEIDKPLAICALLIPNSHSLPHFTDSSPDKHLTTSLPSVMQKSSNPINTHLGRK